MSPVQASCPGCGAAIRFKVGSAIVTICEYCRSVVGRGDRKLEDLGKVAALVETGSLLKIGLKGRYQDVPFELVGRAQIGHQGGGLWDEWYAALADGRWGWLAEAQGRYYLTFPIAGPAAESVHNFKELDLGARVQPAPGVAPLTVTEKGKGRPISAEGDIPYLLVPGKSYPYADLAGPEGEFGTLDYSESPPLVFVGHEVTFEDLGFPPNLRRGEDQAREIEGIHVNCPQCGGGLDLRAPDKTERVGCPNCGSLLDANQGQLRLLKALDLPGIKPVLRLGSTGKLLGVEYMVIGFLRRSVTIEGVKYFWDEYLLYHPVRGFRWLVRSDHHWSFVEPLPPGKARVSGRTALYGDQEFKLFQKAVATVEEVLGEFYWKVEAGEQVEASDYVRPPRMLSREVSRDEDERGEINWSLGTYMRPEEIEAAFGVQKLSRPTTVAPNQPFGYYHIYRTWAWLMIAGFLIGLLMLSIGSNRKVYDHTFQLQPPAATTEGEWTQELHSEPFELRPRRNIRVKARADVTNTWMAVEGDLANKDSGKVATFLLPVTHAGDDDGRQADTYLPAVSAGTYTLRLQIHGEGKNPPAPVQVTVEQGVPRVMHWILALFALSAIPLGTLVYQMIFESRRWRDSSI